MPSSLAILLNCRCWAKNSWGRTEAAHGRAAGAVGIDLGGLEADVGGVHDPEGLAAHGPGHAGGAAGEGAGIDDHVEVLGHDGAVLLHAGLEVNDHLMAAVGRGNVLPPGVDQAHRAARLDGQERCHVLHDHVDLAAEAAAYQHIFYDYLLRRKAQKDRSFMTGIVGTLIGRINQHAAVKWHGNCTFRLQKCMLCPGSLIMAGYFVFGCSNHFICISPHQMLMA